MHENHSVTALTQNNQQQTKEKKPNNTVLTKTYGTIYNTFGPYYIHYQPSLCGHKFGLENNSGMIILMIFTHTARNCKTTAIFNTF